MLINVHDAKTQFSKLLEQAHAGQEIILAKAGKPYARMMPLAPPAPAFRRGGGERHHAGIRLARFGQNDFLTCVRLLQ